MLYRGDWDIESELGHEREVMDEIQQVLWEMRPEETRIEEIITAVSEACLNAIEHGNRFMKDLHVRVSLFVQEDRYVIHVLDEGCGLNLEPSRLGIATKAKDKMNWDSPRGWGLQLMRQYADIVRGNWHEGRFCVELHFLHQQSAEEAKK